MMRIPLSGDLTYQEANAVLERVCGEMTAPEVVLDLTAINEVDSAAIALLLAWQRRANEQQIKLRCENMPDNLRSLAALYDVEALLPK